MRRKGMGKYQKYRYEQVRERRWKVHPIWRGIGFLFLIMVPIMSFAGAILVVRQNFENRWLEVPAELLKFFNVPQLAAISPELAKIYYLDLAVAFAFMVLGFGVISIVYSMLYSMFGPSRYGPVDSPPIRTSPRKRIR
jgi:hypothetical protein